MENMKSLLAAVLVLICIMQIDGLKCATCENFVCKTNGTVQNCMMGDGTNNADCISAPDSYLNGPTCNAQTGRTARCIYGDFTITAQTGDGGSVELKMQNRGCIDFETDSDLDKNGCLKDDDLEDLKADMLEIYDEPNIKGYACICDDEDNCNSAISVQSLGLFTSTLVALAALVFV
ncbi:uncharacterized protein [Amphiura filiformis]|uniref:uncharacterized protein isoform X2 n=1 Tax=Amphiura filiformis TaxID=82378 RepID=UPI003B20E6DD